MSLSEDEKDVQDFDKALSENGEAFPQELVNAILKGGNAIKLFREYRGLTQEELAEKTALSLEVIASIESGHGMASEADLKMIAEGLGVDVGLLL